MECDGAAEGRNVFLNGFPLPLRVKAEDESMIAALLVAYTSRKAQSLPMTGKGEHQNHGCASLQLLCHFRCQSIRTDIHAAGIDQAGFGIAELQLEMEVRVKAGHAITKFLDCRFAIASQSLAPFRLR